MAESMVEKVAKALARHDNPKHENWWPSYENRARAAMEAMRPTNEQILAAIDAWLSEPEGFALRCERKPDTVELGWLRAAALVGAGVVFPAALSEEVKS